MIIFKISLICTNDKHQHDFTGLLFFTLTVNLNLNLLITGCMLWSSRSASVLCCNKASQLQNSNIRSNKLTALQEKKSPVLF